MSAWRRVWVGPPLSGRLFALVLLRALVIVASFTWLAFAPLQVPQRRLVAGLLAAFLAYSLLLIRLLWRCPGRVLRWNLAVMAADMAFALALVHLTGGARSVFFLAFYLIAALQAYYYGLRRGVGVAAAASLLYLAVAWPTLSAAEWPDYALRVGLLLVTAVGLGVLAQVERRERDEIRRLNRELALREERIKDIVESLRDGVLVLDRARRVVECNRALADCLGRPREALIGRPVAEVCPVLGEPGPAAALDRLFEGEQPGFSLEAVVHESPVRGRVVLNVKGSVLRRQDGLAEGVVLLVEDATERVALEQATRQAEKLAAVGTLSTGLAHEINNPIGVITSRIELMLEEADALGLPAALRDDLAVLRRHALRVARITQALLSFARQSPAVKRPIDVNDVVEETLLLVGKQVTQEGITLQRQLKPGLPPVLADPNQLGQVLLNLINNARDAIDGRGEIAIETGPDPERPGWVRLQVRDTGCGIPEAIQARIFDPFFSTKPEGTGLGLSVSYGIVRDHGGVMTVESRVGAGTTFTVSLPQAAAG
ncbi:MAG TPA: ATP-binding protein [Thermodesulfobacteriota bacterium]|nr:ATP-binding protein [Thermodesulfobacteriota bacterium]